MKKFISNGTWFKKGTEAELICQMGNDFGLFKGIRVCENPSSEACPLGAEHQDEEICGFDEFEIIDK